LRPDPGGWRPTADRAVLMRRAALVDGVRAFFRARGVLEVDPPLLQGGANLDHGVVPFAVGDRFLPTSPEHPLKRLVAAGVGAVWALAPAFRAGERGRRHAPEFRMLEWYRPGWDDLRLAEECVALAADITGLPAAAERLPWRTAFQLHAGLDPLTCDDAALRRCAGDAPANATRHELLDLVLTGRVEPHLGRGVWTLLTQARLRTQADGTRTAARFELYRDGVELANGYWELTDAAELRARLLAELAQRGDAGLALDERFLAAVPHLGDCAGVAVGFDRLAMLALGVDDIRGVQCFGWPQS
jgi:lysyl-tRNA synthetase class 2